MKWKEWPYWLKGGIIFLILDFLLLLVLFIFAFISKDIEGLGCGLLFTQLPAIIVFKSLVFGGHILEIILMALFGLIGYFLIGSIIGWIISLITSKDKKNNIINPVKGFIIKKSLLIGGLVGGFFSLIFSFVYSQRFMNSSQYLMYESYRSFSEIFITTLKNSVMFFILTGLIIGIIVGAIKSRSK